MILDEVTSGLDSYTAHRLIETLRAVAQTHQRIFITSLHQPSQAIFSMLDRILLLARGSVVFSGRTRDLPAALSRATLPAPDGTPTADWLLVIVNEREKVDRLVGSAVARSARYRERAPPLDFGTKLNRRGHAPLLYQLGVLVRPLAARC